VFILKCGKTKKKDSTDIYVQITLLCHIHKVKNTRQQILQTVISVGHYSLQWNNMCKQILHHLYRQGNYELSCWL